jgi:phosphatidylglycerol:prolipoprotein diacylglycerol transferase
VAGPRIAFRIGPIAVAWYGIIIVGCAMLGAYLAEREAARRGDNPDHVWSGLVWCLILGLIGARLYHVVSSLDYYRQYPLEIFDTRHGGLAIYGAVAGGALGLWIYTRLQHLSFAHWADIAAPSLPLAQAVARWANFLNQELYGYPTSVPWGITIDAAHRIPPFDDLQQCPLDTRFHPTFLYESLGNLVSFVVMIYISRRFADRLRDGDLILLYGVLYPIVRFAIEFQRPDAWKVAGMPAAQWIAIVSILVCGGLLLRRHRSDSPSPPNEEDLS